MKTIRIVSTAGNGTKSIESGATTWKDLKKEISKDYPVGSMKAVIGETKNTLENEGAQLPVTDFTLFLLPVKTKSGADWGSAGYKELRAEIKRLKDVISDTEFKSAFGNYTQSSTPDLQKLVSKYYKNNTGSVSKTVAPKTPTTGTTVKAPAVKPEINIPGLKTTQVSVTLDIPIGLIPAGTYTKALTDAEIADLRKILY